VIVNHFYSRQESFFFPLYSIEIHTKKRNDSSSFFRIFSSPKPGWAVAQRWSWCYSSIDMLLTVLRCRGSGSGTGSRLGLGLGLGLEWGLGLELG
jgi:hypothetical protein